MFQCIRCNRNYKSKNKLIQHQSNRKIPCYRGIDFHDTKCYECDVEYSSRNALKIHMHTRLHINKESKKYDCLKCGKQFGYKKHYTNHKTNESECDIKCYDCDKYYSNTYNLKKHLKSEIHLINTNGPVTIDVESENDKIVQASATHEFWNDILKKYQCQKCNDVFEYKCYYLRHVNKKLQCDEISVSECKICDKSYSNNSGLKKHLKSKTHLVKILNN